MRIPRPLYEEAKDFLAESPSQKNASVSDLVADSLKERLRMLRKARVDAAFAGMATDRKYQSETKRVASEFEESDWKALRQTEGKGK